MIAAVGGSGRNYEVSYSRGIPAGEYLVNAHMYGLLPHGTTIPITIVVSVKTLYEDTRKILETTVHLSRRGQEETAYRFRLMADGDLLASSVGTLRRPLISGGN